MADLHDDILAAMNSTQESGATPKAGEADFANPASETLPPVYPDDKAKGPARGPDGKFQSQQETQTQQTGQKPEQQTQQQQPPGVAPAPGAQQPPVGTQPQGQNELQFDPAKPPAGWRPEMKAKWNGIPQDVREEITRREQDTAAGVQKLQQYYAPMESIFSVIQPHAQYFDHIQEDPRAYLSSLIQTEQTLRLGNPAQRVSLLLALADQFGVPMRNALDGAMGGKLNEMMQKAHQMHGTPPALPPQYAQEIQQLRQWREQVENQMADQELTAFAAEPGHEYLDHVRDDMANLIEGGYAETYQDAYDLACWRNPQIRPLYIAAQNGNGAAPFRTQVQQRQMKAAAVMTPGAAPLEYGEQQQQGEGEDLHDTVRKAWNASVSGRA